MKVLYCKKKKKSKASRFLRNTTMFCGVTAPLCVVHGHCRLPRGVETAQTRPPVFYVMTYSLRLQRAENGGVPGVHLRHRERQVSFIQCICI